MECLSSRRLTGPNLLWHRPGAVLDVTFVDVDADAAIGAWERHVRVMLDAVGWEREKTCVRKLSGGASLAISAPPDALYAATEINDWAWQTACDELLRGAAPSEQEADVQRLKERISNESNPPLLTLLRAAEKHRRTVLLDPDVVSVGMGGACRQWAVNELPRPEQVDWTRCTDVPIVLITGTNGKTTSARLTGAIVQAAGLRPGMSSTDGVSVDGELVEPGDYSGPGGARAVLRHPDTEFAVLETARGGLLRRGLGVTRADAALITNIASDHLGEFGVTDLEELADVKWVVTRALHRDAILVLNADDPRLVRRGLGSNLNVIWFSPDPENAVLVSHRRQGGEAYTVLDGHIAAVKGAETPQHLLPLTDIPITHAGRAVYNVANVLGVAALTRAMKLPDPAIIAGLEAFDAAANPGRTNLLHVNGATVLVDFAHNPHGLTALLSFAATLDCKRRLLLIGHAGDRADDDIRELAKCTENASFDRIIIKTLDSYRRGREPGAVESLLREQFLAQGVAEDVLASSDNEMAGVQAAIQWSRPGDLLVLLIHDSKKDVLDYLAQGSDPR